MPRNKRLCPGRVAYHVMNRCVPGVVLFEDDDDYNAFEWVLVQALERFDRMRLCSYCLMPNHFHLVLWPRDDGLLSAFMQWLSMTHTQRWRAHRQSAGRGHLYQGRFKSFPIEQDDHFQTVCRYVERNALRAGLVERAQDWPWSSLAAFVDADCDPLLRGVWPMNRPRNWVSRVNRPQTEDELAAIRHCVQRGAPFGKSSWTRKMAVRLNLESTQRPRGRPRQQDGES